MAKTILLVEDDEDIKPEEMGTFIQAIGRELGYSNIVIDIGDGILCIGTGW